MQLFHVHHVHGEALDTSFQGLAANEDLPLQADTAPGEITPDGRYGPP